MTIHDGHLYIATAQSSTEKKSWAALLITPDGEQFFSKRSQAHPQTLATEAICHVLTQHNINQPLHCYSSHAALFAGIQRCPPSASTDDFPSLWQQLHQHMHTHTIHWHWIKNNAHHWHMQRTQHAAQKALKYPLNHLTHQQSGVRPNTSQQLLLIDGSSFLYRAFHGVPPRYASNQQPTNAIYGVISLIRTLLNAYRPTHTAVIFDHPGKNFRHHVFPEYKAHRPAMPDGLRSQKKQLEKLLPLMGFTTFSLPEVEADDVLATLAKTACSANIQTYIASGDKDLAQLVNPHTLLLDTMQHTIMDINRVVEKYGVTPDKIVDYLALLGDKADNLPGLPQVGAKTAKKWLTTFGSIDQLIEQSHRLTPKFRQILLQHQDQLLKTRALIQLKTDCTLPYTLKDLKRTPPNYEKLIEYFTYFNFSQWKEQIEAHLEKNKKAETTS